MSISSNFPALKPSLLLDFANVKALDPRITFTRTTTATYFDANGVMQTAASGVARFDHNPTTGESLGLLVEEQRTNLFTYSAEFDNAAWSKSRVTVTADTIVAPDGTLTGDKLVEDTQTGGHYIEDTITVPNNATLTYSFFAKAGGRTIIEGYLVDSGIVSDSLFEIDLATGSVVSGANATITPVGNGWYRCSTFGTVSGTSARGRVLLNNGSTDSYTGDGYSGIYIWGAQLEAGAFPTSYIATTSASVTRNADEASMTGTNFSSWFNNAEGAVYLDYKTSGQTTAFRVASVSDGTTSNRMEFAIASGGGTGPYLFVVANGTYQVATATGTYTSNTNYKWASAYEINNYAWSKDGGSVVSDTDALVPVVNQLRIAQDGAGGNLFNGTIRKLSFYPSRLTNAQLQALTS